MNEIQILSQSASAIKRVISENNQLKDQNLSLIARIEAIEKQLKEHEEHAFIMQRNQLILAMNSEGTKEIGEELRKTIISTLEEWSSDLFEYHSRETDRSNCCDSSFYEREEEERNNARFKRSQFIQMLDEVLTPKVK